MSAWGPMPMRSGVPWTRVTAPAKWGMCHVVTGWGGGEDGETAHLLRERVLQMHAAHSLHPRNDRDKTKRHLGAPYESARASP